MAATIEQIAEEALKFPEQERARLAYILLRSIESGGIARAVKAAWDAEIANRPVDEACCEPRVYDRLKPVIADREGGLDLAEITGIEEDSKP